MDKQDQVLACLYKMNTGQADVFRNFGEVAAAMRWNGIELGIVLAALKETGDIQVRDDSVALTAKGLARAQAIR